MKIVQHFFNAATRYKSYATKIMRFIYSRLNAVNHAHKFYNVVIVALKSVKIALGKSFMGNVKKNAVEIYFAIMHAQESAASAHLVVKNAQSNVFIQNVQWNVEKYVHIANNLVKEDAYIRNVKINVDKYVI